VVRAARSLGWSLGGGGCVIAEVYHVAEASHVTEVSGLKFRAFIKLLGILHHVETLRLDLPWIPAICPVRREQQVEKVGIQPDGPWPRSLEAEIRIIGCKVFYVAVVELDFLCPSLVLTLHRAWVPFAVIRGNLRIFEEAFHPGPFSKLRSACGQALALVQTITSKALRAFTYQFGTPDLKIWRLRSVCAATLDIQIGVRDHQVRVMW
jgi:hypothetical protein